MDLRKCLLTKNNCYKSGAKMTPKGVMWHSTGANNPNLKRYVQPDDGKLGSNGNGNDWNRPTPGGREVCVHAFIGKDKNGKVCTYQTLPWNYQAWHCGGSGNQKYIAFEICEDGLNDKSYFEKVYKEAVELTAYLCELYNLNPESSNTVICHQDGYKLGIASNHSDVYHWLNKFSKTMEDARKDVKAAMSGKTSGTKVETTHGGTSGHYWATMQLKEFDRTDGQKWIVHKHSDGTYSFKNVASTIYMSVRDGKMVNDQEVWAYSWNDTKSQRFLIDLDESGEIAAEAHIRCCNGNNMVVEVDNGSYADGSRIQIRKENDTFAQKWTFLPTGHEEEYYILNYGSGKALDVTYK